MQAVVPVIMVGGAGSRLWPVSRRAAPKPFHALVTPETLLRHTAERVRGEADGVRFTAPMVVANVAHQALVAAQMDGPARLVLEPSGRGTAPCAVVAALLVQRSEPEALVLLLPADHHVPDPEGFRRAVASAAPAAAAGRLVTFGVRPTRPETGFGYILPAAGEALVRPVERFVEKPDAATAAGYLAGGRHLWNGGVFLMRSDVLLAEMARWRPDILEGATRALDLGATDGTVVRLDPAAFAACPSDSLDYAVMERTEAASVAPLEVAWSDVGGFDALWEAADKDAHGNAAAGDVVLQDVTGSLVESDGPLVAVAGVSDLVVVVRDGAVLIVPRARAGEVKGLVEQLTARGRTDAL